MPDDLRSLVFDSEPLSEDLEILGNPLVKLRLSASEPVAKVAVRLNEVTPDGRSWSVSYGILNLTHRDSHTDPTPLVVGRDYDVEVSCYFTAHRFKRGNRVRIALSESLWPMIWPSPKPVELSILTGVSSLTLPARPRGIVDPPMPIQEIKGRVAAEERADTLSSSRYEVRQSGPDAHGRVIIHKRLRELPEMLTDIGTTISGGSDWFMSIQEGDPNSSVWQLRWFSKLTRGDWDTMTESSMELSSTAEEFRIKESITAWEASKPVFERSWDNRIKRDLI